MQDLWFIPPSDFLARVTAEDRDDLRAMAERRLYAKDDFVFQAGAPGRNVYLLIDGRIKIFRISPSGRELILWFCFPGELFGLADLPRSGRREVYAQTCTPSEILQIRREDFQEFLATHPSAAMLAIELLSCRLRVLGDMLLNLATDDVGARVVKLILRLSARYGRPVGDEVDLDIHLTHQEMADMIGTSRQTVTTVLGDLKRQGVLAIQNHRIRIRSSGLLQDLAEDGALGRSAQV